LAAALGEFIAWCDDDDEWHPQHLEHLHGAIDSDTALVYADSVWRQEGAPAAEHPAFSVPFDTHALTYGNYIFATDALARVEPIRRVGGFDSKLTAYEDWDLWLRLSVDARLHHVDDVLAVREWRPDAVLAEPDWETWLLIYERHRQRLKAAGLDGCAELLRHRWRDQRFRPETWRAPRRELIWQSRLTANEGYGSVGRQLLQSLAAADVDVRMAASRNDPQPGYERHFREWDDWGRLAFYYDYRGRPGSLPVERIVNYFMWESTSVPARFVDEINRFVTMQLVPCRQNAESFVASGVSVPVDVLPHGIDVGRFPRLVRPDREVMTFGTFGDLSPRKGIDVLIRAFVDEFAPGEPVRLVIKGGGSASAYQTDSPLVTVLSGYFDDERLLRFLGDLDVFVLPSRGEGFGLCALEAMSTGLPLIATNWSGPADYLDPADSYPLDFELVDCKGQRSNHVEYFGQWAEPSYEHLRALMREIANKPGAARSRGEAAAERVHRDWTWDAAARRLRDYLDKVANR
jgi:glycosyltransferase involved in cell wall biosynthesis